MQRLVIIDVTRMGHGNCCIAGVCRQEDYKLYRLNTPCTSQSYTRENGIEPGAVFVGSFFVKRDVQPPHIEDCQWSLSNREGFATDADFKKCLESGLVSNLREGLGIKGEGTPVENFRSVGRSIVTVRPQSVNRLRIFDPYSEGEGKKQNVKLDFSIIPSDQEWSLNRCESYEFIMVNDFRFYNLDGSINKIVYENAQTCLKNWRNNTLDLYLRVGLTRAFKKKGEGEVERYWLQVDGLHFFRKDTGAYCRDFNILGG